MKPIEDDDEEENLINFSEILKPSKYFDTSDNKFNLHKKGCLEDNLIQNNFNKNNKSYIVKHSKVKKVTNNRHREYINELNKGYEYYESQRYWNKIAIVLVAFCLGISMISDLAVQYYFKDQLNLNPAAQSQILSLTQIPWILKPVYGAITDLVPFLNYRRKSYLFLTGIVNIFSWYSMSLCKDEVTASILLILINSSLCFGSVIGEALIVELSQIPSSSSNINNEDDESKSYVSLFFMWKYIGLLLSSLLKGFLLEIVSVNTIFIISAIIPILYVISSFIIKEKRASSKNEIEINYNNKDIEASTYNKTSHNNNNIHCAKLLSELSSFLCNKFIYVPCCLLVAYNLFSPNYNDPFFYFLVDVVGLKASCFGIITFYSTLATLFAILIYQKYFINVGFKKMIFVCALLQFIFSFIPILVVKRMSIDIGIPDYLLVIVNNSVNSMLSELVILPMLSLACLLCPPNLEATVYSVFVSALNLGNALANLFGAILTETYGIANKNYDNMDSLILICNLIGFIPLPLILMMNESYFHPEENKNVQICKSRIEEI